MAEHQSGSSAVVWGSHTSGVDGAFDARLLRVVDGCLAGCIVAVPFLMGGRQALGQLVLVTLALTAAITWAVRQAVRSRPSWRPAPAAIVVFAAVLVVVLVQLVPMPTALVGRIAPRTLELLPLWNPDANVPGRLGAWQTISFTPSEGRSALGVFLAYAMIFLVTAQRIRVREDVERLLRWCGLAAALMAVFGLLQYLLSNDKFFWCYEHPYTKTSWAAKGSFPTANHFAQFLALGLGPLIWWMQAGWENRQRSSSHGGSRIRAKFRTGLLAAAVAVVLIAGVLSYSRGGAVVIALALAVTMVVCFLARSVAVKLLAGLAVVFVLVASLVAAMGYDRVAGHFDELTSEVGELATGSVEHVDKQEARQTIWATVARAIPHHAAFGSGVGSHREVYPIYLEKPPVRDTEYTHAENSYLQVALEAGVPGIVLAVLAMVLCAAWCLRAMRGSESNRGLVMAGAIAASLAANAAHAVVDFVWYVPGCMAVVAVLAACAFRLAQLTGDRSGNRVHSRPIPRPVAWAAAVGLAAIGFWLVSSRIGSVLAEPVWHRYLVARMAEQSPSTAADLTPESAEALRRQQLSRIDAEKQRIADLETVVGLESDHIRGHLELAESRLRLFSLCQEAGPNPMSLSDIRDAAIQSQFRSREELEGWLGRAVGEHWTYLKDAARDARRGLELCPLEGRGYIYLSELCFLDGGSDATKAAYVSQALRLRPFDGPVLYSAGLQAWREGRPDEWLRYWQTAFRGRRGLRQTIVTQLILNTPEEGQREIIDFILKEFQPDAETLKVMHTTASDRAPPEDLAAFREQCAQALIEEAKKYPDARAASLWLDAQDVYRALGDGRRAMNCALEAQKLKPNAYPVHLALALCLIDLGQYADAETHLHWCAQRRGNTGMVREALRSALRGRLDGDPNAPDHTKESWYRR